jgi:hypothetical protein
MYYHWHASLLFWSAIGPMSERTRPCVAIKLKLYTVSRQHVPHSKNINLERLGSVCFIMLTNSMELRSHQQSRCLRFSQHCMETKVHTVYTRALHWSLYPEPDQSSPYHPVIYPLKYYTPVHVQVFLVGTFFQGVFPHRNSTCVQLLPPRVLHALPISYLLNVSI